MLLAALPIVWTPNIAVPQETSGTLKAAMPGMLLFASDAFFAGGYVFVWQIALFLSLGESFSAFGGAMALAAFAGAVGGLLLGRLIDAGHGTHAAIVALIVLAATTMLASHQRRQCAACGAGECERCAGRLPLCAGAWHRYLQSSQALAMHAALPHRFRSRLGPRRRQCLAGCGRAVAGRRADRRLPSCCRSSAPWRRFICCGPIFRRSSQRPERCDMHRSDAACGRDMIVFPWMSLISASLRVY